MFLPISLQKQKKAQKEWKTGSYLDQLKTDLNTIRHSLINMPSQPTGVGVGTDIVNVIELACPYFRGS
jgi:hypothetical protein